MFSVFLDGPGLCTASGLSSVHKGLAGLAWNQGSLVHQWKLEEVGVGSREGL
jgi:hypothetical protein